MNNDAFDRFLSRALKRPAAAQSDEAAAARVLKRLAGPLPRQKLPFWRLPAVLLDWQFAPAPAGDEARDAGIKERAEAVPVTGLARGSGDHVIDGGQQVFHGIDVAGPGFRHGFSLCRSRLRGRGGRGGLCGGSRLAWRLAQGKDRQGSQGETKDERTVMVFIHGKHAKRF